MAISHPTIAKLRDRLRRQQTPVAWFLSKVRTVVGIRTKLMNNAERQRSTTVIGKMFFFWYDPKWKMKLPIYDRFPMVFPIERYKDGFLGLNLHYLPIPMRRYLLNGLMQFASNNKLDEKTKLKLSYQLLKSTTLMPMVQPCIHRYLLSHVRSPFVEITADEWQQAIQLPVQVWVKKRNKP